MGKIPKPTIRHYGEDDSFLSPPGQPDSLIDHLARAQLRPNALTVDPTVICIIELDSGGAEIVLRRRR